MSLFSSVIGKEHMKDASRMVSSWQEVTINVALIEEDVG